MGKSVHREKRRHRGKVVRTGDLIGLHKKIDKMRRIKGLDALKYKVCYENGIEIRMALEEMLR